MTHLLQETLQAWLQPRVQGVAERLVQAPGLLFLPGLASPVQEEALHRAFEDRGLSVLRLSATGGMEAFLERLCETLDVAWVPTPRPPSLRQGLQGLNRTLTTPPPRQLLWMDAVDQLPPAFLSALVQRLMLKGWRAVLAFFDLTAWDGTSFAPDRNIHTLQPSQLTLTEAAVQTIAPHLTSEDVASLLHWTAGWPELLLRVLESLSSEPTPSSRLEARLEAPLLWTRALELLMQRVWLPLDAAGRRLLEWMALLETLPADGLEWLAQGGDPPPEPLASPRETLFRLLRLELVQLDSLQGSAHIRMPALRQLVLFSLQVRRPERLQAMQLAWGQRLMALTPYELPAALHHLGKAGALRDGLERLESSLPFLLLPAQHELLEAIVQALETLESGPERRHALVWSQWLKARQAGARGDWRRQATLLRDVLRVLERGACPGLDRARVGDGLAESLFRAEAWEEAFEVLERLEASDAGRARTAYLKGTLFIHQGHFQEANRALERAIALARAQDDSATASLARLSLGALSIRTGALADGIRLYRQELHPENSVLEPRYACILQLNLGMAHLMRGEIERAQPLLRRALALKQQLEDTAGVANALGSLACLDLMRGQLEQAAAGLNRARLLAESAGARELSLEISVMSSRLAQRRGDWLSAAGLLERARALAVPGIDGLLEGLLAERNAEAALETRQVNAAVADIRRARRAFVRCHAAYCLARLDLLWAALVLAQGNQRLAEHVLVRVSRRVVPGQYLFFDVALFKQVLAFGLRLPNAIVREACARLLRRPQSMRLQELPESSLQPSTAQLNVAESSPEAVARRVFVVERTGEHWIPAGELERRLEFHHDLDFVLDLSTRKVWLRPDQTVSVAHRQVLVALLTVLLRAPQRIFTAQELHREVWGDERFDEAAQTRLRVAVSRLRTLMVGVGGIVMTVSSGHGGSRQGSYHLDTALRYLLVEG